MVLVYTNPAQLVKAFFLFLPLEAVLDFGPDVLASILYRYAGIELLVLSIGGQRKRRYVVYVKSVPFLRSLRVALNKSWLQASTTRSLRKWSSGASLTCLALASLG